jgi:argininosuccinate lyase
LAEDLVIWSSKEFSFVEADDSFCTGSSLMPQKKNPDVLELVRGNSGRFYGNLVSVLVTMKGLPLSYNRDMQLDKEPLFSSIETVSSQIRVLAALVKTLKFNKASIEQFLEDESLYATDLVYYLVERGVPFATAHSIVGKLIRHSIESGIEIKTMTDKELGKFSEKLSWSQILRLFNPKVSAASKRSVKR